MAKTLSQKNFMNFIQNKCLLVCAEHFDFVPNFSVATRITKFNCNFVVQFAIHLLCMVNA